MGRELSYADPMKLRWVLVVMTASALAGASVVWLMTSRYDVISAGEGIVVKVDRWTGKTWRTSGSYGGWRAVGD